MRHLTPAGKRQPAGTRPRRPAALRRGLTLIELMVTLAVGAVLMSMAAPALSDFWINHQLREAGNLLQAEALHARAEAIKRNGSVRLSVSGSSLSLQDMSAAGDGAVLRQRQLPEGISASGSEQMTFDSRGILLPLGTEAAVNIARSGITCSADFRCPGLRVDGGGAVRLCSDRLACP